MSKVTRQQIRRMILEETASMRAPRKRSLASFVFEDADPAKIDPARFPTKLSDSQGVKDIEKIVTSGLEDSAGPPDDKVPAAEASFPCSKLLPSQSSMNIDKAVGMAFGMIKSGKVGGKLGAFISNDRYIMDGHHRWISSFMVDPSSTISGYKVELPGQQLVAVLNALTAGRFKEQGKAATGGFEQFKSADAMKAAVQKVMDEGVKGKDDDGKPVVFVTPEEAQDAAKKFGGDADGCVKKFMENLKGATMTVPDWAPTRPDMPVIEKPNVPKALDALNNGEIDMNPPYSDAGTKAESRARYDNLVMERWQKMAGLIKG